MPHFCIDELLAIMMLFPFIGIYIGKLHAWYHTKFKHKCHDKSCDDTHIFHSEEDLKVDSEIPASSNEEEIKDPFEGWRLTIKGFVAGHVMCNGPLSENELISSYHEDDALRLKEAVAAALADGTIVMENGKLVFGEL